MAKRRNRYLCHDYVVPWLHAERYSNLAGAQQLQFHSRHLHPFRGWGLRADGTEPVRRLGEVPPPTLLGGSSPRKVLEMCQKAPKSRSRRKIKIPRTLAALGISGISGQNRFLRKMSKATIVHLSLSRKMRLNTCEKVSTIVLFLLYRYPLP